MTNLEKFTEIFGFEPDTSMGVHKCPDMEPETACPYFEADLSKTVHDRLGCCCENWWNEEYKELKNAKPAPILKDTPHIVSIFSCPHYLPCGWCDKRDGLCNQTGGKI